MPSLKKLIENPSKIIYVLNKTGFDRVLTDEAYIKLRFKANMGKWPDLENPETFNEKLQWLKLHNRKPEYVAMVDKYEVKKHIANVVGEEYTIPTLGIWERFDDIDFDLLPKQFVLKCTHDSGGLVIVKDKNNLNVEDAKKKIEKAWKRNFYYCAREWPYKFVHPRIIAEEYLEDSQGGGLTDYKVHNFNGEPQLILVCKDRFEKTGVTEDFYSAEWNRLDVGRPNTQHSIEEIKRPDELGEMLDISRKLSRDIPFLRTDFYIVDHHLYVGELTFYPTGAFTGFVPEEWDYKFGSWLNL